VKLRTLGRTGFEISTVSFGAWAIGGTWGQVDDSESLAALHKALDLGVNFFDTADVYGDGHSEKLLARLRRERKEPFWVTTKAGRRSSPHVPDQYHYENLRGWIERSLRNLETDAIDLLQLHCPPTDVYYRPEVFGALDRLVTEGKIRHYGVSVERVEEALKAIEYPGVESVQIIFNLLRRRPADLLFQRALEKRVGVLARLPLSSGLLAGKLTASTQFASDDHRHFNRKGEAFDRGETFSGIDYQVGLEIVEELRRLVPTGMTLAELALRWILDHEAVTCVIPGAKRPTQVAENARAAELPPLSPELHRALGKLYDERVRGLVHHFW
jgi:aryl-alcohol dehydrogenase-like predicted oxidoreductase